MRERYYIKFIKKDKVCAKKHRNLLVD